MDSVHPADSHLPRKSPGAWTMIGRALRLKCPECGISPMFMPISRVRSIWDWFTPLDGCPRCGYAYERETGYFLLSIWAINYGLGSIFGILIYAILEFRFNLSLPVLLISVISPVIIFNFLVARHSKSLFLALDHFFDPHQKNGDGDGGSKLPATHPTKPSTPEKSPTCEPPIVV